MDDDRYKRMISGKISAIDHIERQMRYWHECFAALDAAKADPDDVWGEKQIAAWLNNRRIRPPNPNGVRRPKWNAKTVGDRLFMDTLFVVGKKSTRGDADDEGVFTTSIADTTQYGLGAVATLQSFGETDRACADRAYNLIVWVWDRLPGEYAGPAEAVEAMGEHLTARVEDVALRLRGGWFKK